MHTNHHACPTAAPGVVLVGDPVDVVTGAMLDVAVDFRLAGAPSFSWRRYYDSTRADENHGLGWGHFHELDHRLVVDLDGLTYCAPDSFRVAFPHMFDAGAESVAQGVKLTCVDETCFVLEGHGRPSMRFRQGGGTGRVFLLDRSQQGSATTSLEYDHLDQLTRVATPADDTLEIGWQNGRLLNVKRVRFGEPAIELVRYHYDERGCLFGGQDAYRQKFYFEYDQARRLTKKTDRRGYSFLFTYDRAGRCTQARGQDGVLDVRLEYRPLERATVVTESSGGQWLYLYDDDENLSRVVDPFGGTRILRRGDDGRLLEEIDPAGGKTTYSYDESGAVVAKTDPRGRRTALPTDEAPLPDDRHRVGVCPLQWELGDLQPLGFEAPDDLPRHQLPPIVRDVLRSASDEPALAPVREERDEQGLLLAQVRADGRRRQYAYDPNGNVRRVTDFDGSKREYTHASWNHQVGEVDPLGRRVAYAYTKAERLAAAVSSGGAHSDFGYDQKDRLSEVRRQGTVRERYAYDADDNLTEKRDAEGNVVLELAWAPGKLLKERRLASGDIHRFAHDARGRVVEASTDAGKCEFAYDAWGHRTRDVRDGRGVEHRYVGDDVVSSVVLGSFETTYERTSSNSVAVTDPTGSTHTLRQLAPGVWQRTFADGFAEVAQFTPEGRVLSKTAFDLGQSTPAWQREFTYSGEGDLLAIRDSSRGVTAIAHDAAHRIARVSHPDGSCDDYAYDSGDNLIRKPGLDQVTVDAGDRLTAANGFWFTRDARNHVATWRTVAAEGPRLTRDSRDQLVRIELPDGNEWSATYDALGRRTSKSVRRGNATRTWAFFWDTDRLAAELMPDGRLRVYVYPDNFALVPLLFVEYESIDAEPESGKRFYLFTDHQGTPILVRDSTGAPVWWARREPYSVEVEGGHDFHQPLRFPGHYCDAETGLHYNRFRYYSPQLGRYLESDPFGVAGGLNLYAYTENPLRQVDVRGLKCDDDGPSPAHPHEGGPDSETAARPRRGAAQVASDAFRAGWERIFGRPARTDEVLSTATVLPDGAVLPAGSRRVSINDGEAVHYVDPAQRPRCSELDYDPPSTYEKEGVNHLDPPPGFVSGRDHRGHLAPERAARHGDLVNLEENVIAEHGTRSNLGPKKRWENRTIRYAQRNPSKSVRSVSIPIYEGDGVRPVAVEHRLLVDGQVDSSFTVVIPNPEDD